MPSGRSAPGSALIDAVGRPRCQIRKLQARVGIATGLVVVGDLIGEGSAQEQSVVGETPEPRRPAASPGRAGHASSSPQATRRLVGDLFEYRDLGAVDVKGIAAPVPAWQVLRPSVVASRFEALRGSALTPLVGRDEEIDLLLRRWARAKARRRPGRADLRRTRHRQVAHHRGIGGAPPRRAASPPALFLLAVSPGQRAVSRLSTSSGARRGSRATIRPRLKLDKLEALLARAAPPDDDVALLADLLSLPASERYPLPNLSPQRKKERTLEALIRQLEGLARQQPVLMVFEDAHWIDPTSRELLDLTVERVAQPAGAADRHVPSRIPAALDRPAAGDDAGAQPAGPARPAPRWSSRSPAARRCPLRSSPRSSSAPTACRCLSRN